ncbi:DNA primase [Acetobacter nitrogenifigens DSM 23921 = NBRC 105050]|uniref:DNA primase n=1 Tax=Acetobacter nitrogenifigens DSM 23921 = NBRC 105050 TaxID=1120919 RepID=A0A511XA42_9PROT|nr:DNA primase [Acetobacter nitrogenifigens]GBQ97722.1 DNA primase [Acetobacter nitrogenifigens DSM 23921 = NBRC 105050]GEN59823.1 DNA primase [Acetobacter nitrogenifigens DSM 23921 = NBRC 105050]
MSLDPAFLDELRARTPIAALIGRRVKLARSGRNWKGCCPFHGEKTPSFYVYDDHFHCFGCGAHGDAISFVMQMEGKSFPEAVESLAGEAALEVPKASPRAREEAARARSLGDVLEATQRIWSRDLYEPTGRAGLDYLRGRGLTAETIAAFGLGWATDRRGALVDALRPLGITSDAMAEAGLMRLDEDGRPKGELFWGRVTFPIRDRRGDLVSFGGRILGDGQPKYLNGPETALFSKRRLLFGLDRARAAIRAPRPKGAASVEAVVVEGYMDVIALHQAGFTGAVAPLGTALTSEQLEVLWQVAPAPILCFDGDAAGRRAAIRAAETAMPLLSAERGLRFCVLPDGEDPDSLIRNRGREAVVAMFAGASPLSEMLFELLAEGTPANATPEQRAALRARLIETAAKIPDKGLASEYRATLLDRFFATYRGRRGGAGLSGNRRKGDRGGSWNGRDPGLVDIPPPPAGAGGPSGVDARLGMLAVIAMRHPELISGVEDAWCRLDLPPDQAELREALLDYASSGDLSGQGGVGDGALEERVLSALASRGLRERAEALIRNSCLPRPGATFGDGLTDVAPEVRWWHFYASVNRQRFEAEIAQDTQSWIDGGLDPIVWDRLKSRLEAQASLRVLEDGSF